ncbi:MAG: molybdate ABC transporter permease subunit [Burkholderiaceae bacterium]
MDWQALTLSVKLAVVTLLVLLLPSLVVARWLARSTWRHKAWLEAAMLMPLVLPPTVLGYYLLVGMGGSSWVGQWLQARWGLSLTFNFLGLVLASVVFNIPFMVQPMLRACEAIPQVLREAGLVNGLRPIEIFWRIELPLIWPGVLSALVITFVHTLGEFGVVLMVGGNIPGETKTIAIAIYDRVQAFDLTGAHLMSLTLVLISMLAVAASLLASRRLASATRTGAPA